MDVVPYASLLLIALLNIVAFWRFRPLGIRHVTLVFTSAIGLSVTSIDIGLESMQASGLYALGIMSLFAGMFLTQFGTRSKRPALAPSQPTSALIDPANTTRRIGTAPYLTALLIFLIATYHVIAAGPALFAEDILVARFQHGETGFFGIPGRMYQFGVYLAFFILVAAHLRSRTTTSKRLAYTGGVALLIFLVLAGNKGNALQFIAALTVVSPMLVAMGGHGRIRRGLPAWAYFVLGAMALAVFLAIASIQVEASNASMYADPVEALWKRITEVSGVAFSVVVYQVAPSEGFGFGAYFINDVRYLFSKLLGTGDAYATIQIASSYVTGRDLDSGLFLVPVTITAIGYGYLELGVLGVMVIPYLLGLTMKLLAAHATKAPTPFGAGAAMYMQLVMFWVITKGGVGYFLINVLATLLVAYLLYRTLRIRVTNRRVA